MPARIGGRLLFPGCGSERLFSQVGLATQAMLGTPAPPRCCRPATCAAATANLRGDEDRGQQITTTNRVLFHRVANTLNYLDIRTVVVSCGTCMDQLLKYEFDKIFPWLPPRRYPRMAVREGHSSRWHRRHQVHVPRAPPCPMKHHAGIKVANALMGQAVALNDRCCGESGTLPVSRPDVSTQVRFRKQQEIEAGAARLRQGDDSAVKIPTSRPFLPGRAVALPRRRKRGCRLHRGRDGEGAARSDWMARIARRQCRRHRAGTP